MSGKKYEGVLLEPMELRRRRLLTTDESWRAYEEKNFSELIERVSALFAHYEVDPEQEGSWRTLALALATEHVPGFRYQIAKPGRPPERARDDVVIYYHVTRLVADNHPVANACRIIEEHGYVKDLKSTSIRQRYIKFRDGPLGQGFERVKDEFGQDFLAGMLKDFAEEAVEK